MSIYVIVASLILLGEWSYLYARTTAEIGSELDTLQRTFHDSMAHALWNMNQGEINTQVNTILAMPSVTRVTVSMPNGEMLRDVQTQAAGKQSAWGGRSTYVSHARVMHHYAEMQEDQKPPLHLGFLEIQSNDAVIFNRLKQFILLSIGAVALQSLVLIILVRMYFVRILSRPLFAIARKAAAIDPKNIANQPLPVKTSQPDELDVISQAINGLSDEVRRTVQAMDSLNRGLETQVVDRTRRLQEANVELEQSLQNLRMTQASLVESEKMAALGSLVAGVAHEINTPVGLGLTGASHFQHAVDQIEKKYRAGELEERDFERFIADSKELARSIYVSLDKAAALVRSFKLVAVDQSQADVRSFEPESYINDIVLTHRQGLKKAGAQVHITVEAGLVVHSYPGAWSQILSNFLTNSLIHGFSDAGTAPHRIDIDIRKCAQDIVFVYRDNGKGMSPEVAQRVFAPFFTTNRQGGGSGLGMHVVYNLVTQQLHGTIQLHTRLGEGVAFTMRFPADTRPPST